MNERKKYILILIKNPALLIQVINFPLLSIVILGILGSQRLECLRRRTMLL